MSIVRTTLDPNRQLTPEEIKMLEELKNREIDFSDIPELTDEQLAQFVRVKELRQADRRKQTVTLRLSPAALSKAKMLGKGYTSVLSRIIEKALNDSEFLKSCL